MIILSWRNFLRSFHVNLLIQILCIFVLGSQVSAKELKLAILHANVDLFDYEISVARLAADKAGYDLEIIPIPDVNQERLLRELETGTSRFNLFFTGFSKDRESRFAQVDIPITRGLLGHRAFIARRTALKDFEKIRTLENLKKEISIGSGVGWPDTYIFEAAGFRVVTATYENLWRMLSANRYDAFNRGVNEIFIEMEQREDRFADLVIEPTQMVGYKFDYFFYLNKENQQIANDLNEALQHAYLSGEFMDNFTNHPSIKNILVALKESKRNVYYIPNPLLSERIKNLPDQYWQIF